MTAKSDRRKISRHERRVATELGGRKTFASGSGDEKGDGVVARQFIRTADGITVSPRISLRIENKITSHDYYTLTALDWEKISSAAARGGEEPFFHIQLTVPGIPAVELAIIRECLAHDLGIAPDEIMPARTASRSYKVSWNRWRGGPPTLIRLTRITPHPIRGHYELLVLASYYDVKNRLSEIQ